MSHPSSQTKMFERGSSYDQNNKKYHSHYIIHCSKCPVRDELRFNKLANALPTSVTEKKFSQKGWVIGATRSNDVCPKCVDRLVTDRQNRKDATAIEQKKARTDMVIAEAKVPTPTHPPISDVELSRRQLILMDRSAELHRSSVYISTMLTALLDRAAELEKQNLIIQNEILALGKAPEPEPEIVAPIIINEEEMFERVKLQSHLPMTGLAVRVAHYSTGRHSRSVITLSEAVARQAGIGGADRVFISQGTDEDEGIIKIELAKEDDQHAVKVWRERSKAIRITTTTLHPKQPRLKVEATDARYKVESDGVYVRLPAIFMTAAPTTITQPFAAEGTRI